MLPTFFIVSSRDKFYTNEKEYYYSNIIYTYCYSYNTFTI